MSDIGNTFKDMFARIIDFLPTLGLGLLIFLFALWLSSVIAKRVRKVLEGRKVDTEVVVLLQLLTKWGLRILGFVIAIEIVASGTLGSLIAGIGVVGFTIGFALQDIAKNFIAGILLLLQQPFSIGDAIEVTGYAGTVEKISLRTTELRTWDGQYVLIPNGDVYVSSLVNFSRSIQRRIEITVGIDYESDLDQVARVAMEAIRGIPGLLDDPEPSILFANFGESAIEFTAYCWVETEEAGLANAIDAGIRLIQEAFHREGIKIPFPTRQILSVEA